MTGNELCAEFLSRGSKIPILRILSIVPKIVFFDNVLDQVPNYLGKKSFDTFFKILLDQVCH